MTASQTTCTQPCRLMLVDDHVLFRTGLRLIMAQNPRISPDVLEAGSVTEAMSLLKQSCPDVILLDIIMPGIDGLEGLRMLRQACPDARIAVLSAMTDARTEQEAMSRTANGCLAKSADAEEIHRAINALLDGQYYFPSLATITPQHSLAAISLTSRQLEVLALMAEGGSNKAIARKLNLSENTVRNHVSAILDHFGANSRMEAMFAARSQGILR